MKLTDEQQAIIDATPPEGGSLLVTAFAGTGKTFTLEKYAEARSTNRILYVAFNKAIQLEAERKMPSNVMSRTTHSLAYRVFGAKYQKAGLFQFSVPLWRISKLLGLWNNIVVANFVDTILKKFLSSPDRDITEAHFTQDILDYYEGALRPPPLIQMAKRVWEDMKSMQSKSLPMTHDGYLKLYQLSEPVLDFDYIMLDEAQDTTPCVWDIMKKQKCRKIVVGDPFQAIYEWRGSIDALSKVEDAESLYLSKSFRFGPEVAKLATTLLQRFLGEKRAVSGLESLSTEIHTTGYPESPTIIARGNNFIFRSAASECGNGERTFGFVGGDHTNYRFQSVLDVYHVYNDEPDMAKDSLIKSFKSYEELIEYSGKVHSYELESAIQLVDEYGSRIPNIIKEVKKRDVGAQYSDLTYTTGHKAKGLEFPVVQLAPDFSGMIEAHKDDPGAGIINSSEMNLLYVAITRGTEKLFISPTIKDFIENGYCTGNFPIWKEVK